MSSSHPLHARFLTFLPRIEAHARVCFRGIRCPDLRADRIQEVIGLAWAWFVRLEKRGKDCTKFISAIATYAVKAVRCGRRVAGAEKAKDVLNPRTQQRHGFVVEKLPDFSTLSANTLTDALAETSTPPPDAAAFRIDFPRWMGSLPGRDRRLAEKLMVGERTIDVAHRFEMSPARVSQLRRELSRDWDCFHGEPLASIA